MNATTHPAPSRRYAYVGPARILEAARNAPAGAAIRCRDDLLAWLKTAHHDEDSPGWATYVVDLGGTLRLAHRRTEHVACAGGESVLAAGEVEFALDGEVLFLSNNSSGYCPDGACLPAVPLSTVRRMEKGDPRVPIHFYARALCVFGELAALADLLDTPRDDIGLTLMDEQLPQRVRSKAGATGAR